MRVVSEGKKEKKKFVTPHSATYTDYLFSYQFFF